MSFVNAQYRYFLVSAEITLRVERRECRLFDSRETNEIQHVNNKWWEANLRYYFDNTELLSRAALYLLLRVRYKYGASTLLQFRNSISPS